MDEVGEKLDIGDTPLEISTEVMEDKESKEEDGSEVIKVYIFKAEADDDLGNLLFFQHQVFTGSQLTVDLLAVTNASFFQVEQR